MTEANNSQEVFVYLNSLVQAGDHWYVAVLKAMSRWDQAEEEYEGRKYRYLICGEAFDWLLLAERLTEQLETLPAAGESEALLFDGRPALQIDEDEFQLLIGTPKYQAYLNYLYGVVVEEALQIAVEEEVAKEWHGHIWSADSLDNDPVFARIYGHSQSELLQLFQKERGVAPSDEISLTDLKEFTYWLFKYRYRNQELERVASDTRKGLAMLSRIEAARHRRLEPQPLEAV